MAEIGKVTPGAAIPARLPREHPVADEKGHKQGHKEEPHEQTDGHEDDKNKHDKDDGIDVYV